MNRGLVLLLSVYVAGLVTANAIAVKLVDVLGYQFTVGAIAYPVTFVLQDVLSERYGRGVSRAAVVGGFLGALMLVVYSWVAIQLPESLAAPVGDAFVQVFDLTPRIVLGSLSAFVIGGLVDVRVFFLIRARTGAAHLWLRKLGSTVVSQWVDTSIFVVVAFGGVLAPRVLLTMVVGQYLLKMTVAAGSLPVSYATLWCLR